MSEIQVSSQPVAATGVPAVVASTLPGAKIMLMGPTGTGKTHSIGTALEAGLRVVFFAYEQGVESLLGYFTDNGKPIPENLHICTVKAPTASFLEMADMVKTVNTLSFDTLIKQQDPARSKYNQLEHFLRTFNDVTTDKGLKLGSVQSWGTDTMLVVDGLTGLCSAAMKACIGGKFARDQKDWGLAQNMVEEILRKTTAECQCWFTLISHVERETDPNGGGLKLMASALGRALAPKLPTMFSDVILCKRMGSEWYWDTEDPAADLKTRNLPIATKNLPDFRTIVAKWQSRGGVIST